MITQLVKVPLYSIRENDIVYDDRESSLKIVIDIICEYEKDIKIRTISTLEYESNKEMGGIIRSYETRDYYSPIYKLVEITEDDIGALIRIKKELS